jgi:hypothetical protein
VIAASLQGGLRTVAAGVRPLSLARTMLPLPFPREVVRDLLGITRALFRAERAKPSPDGASVERLRQIGVLYREAMEMGARYAADTMAGRAARGKAERATAALGEFVAESELMAPAVAATAERLRRAR